jgi:predicted Zn finger-like uncharacterized protein
MDVKCENCGTVYSLDETLVSASGTSVRCTKCSVVFKVYRFTNSNNENDPWIVKHTDGTVVSFDRMAVLQHWISEGKISKDDLISKKGGASKRIGDMPEMQPFFSHSKPRTVARPEQREARSPGSALHTRDALAKTLLNVSAAPQSSERSFSNIPLAKTVEAPSLFTPPRDSSHPAAKDTSTPKFPKSPHEEVSAQGPASVINAQRTTLPPGPVATTNEMAPEDREEPDLSQVPASAERDAWDQGDSLEVAGPAWAERPGGLPRYEDEIDQLPPPKRKIGRWIALFTVIAIIGGGFYLFLFKQSTVDQLWGDLLKSSKDDRYQKFFDRGRENFLLDSETQYRQADREFQKVLALEENHGPTLAALAEMYAVWAQYLRDAKLDAEAVGEKKIIDTESKNKELERLNQSYKEKLAEASRWAMQAMSIAPELKEVNRAMADVKRLQGDIEKAKIHLAEARKQGSDPETEYVATLIDMDEKKPPEELEKQLAKIVGETPLIRAIYRQARILAYLGRAPDAKTTLNKLFELNSNHLRGRDLAARIEEGEPIALVSDAKPRSEETQEDRAPDAGVETTPKGPAAKQPTPVRPTDKEPVQKVAKTNVTIGVDNIETLLMQAAKAQESGRTGEAMGLFNRVLEISPNNIEALSGLGYCYLDKGNSGQAIATFRRIISINPSFGPALLGLAETFKSSGQKEQALKYYQKYLEANPSGRQSGLAKRNIKQLESEVQKPSGEEETAPPNTEEKPLPDKAPSAEPEEDTSVVITPSSGEEPSKKE